MNFSYKKTMDKQKELVSTQNRLTTRSLFSLFKFLLYTIILAVVTIGFLGIGMIKGLIDSAPSIDEVSIVPSSYSTTVFDKDNKSMAKLVTSGSNRIKISIKYVPEYLKWHSLILKMNVYMNITELTFRVLAVLCIPQ